MDPAALRYAKTHEWVRMEGDRATVGITDFAVQQLTDLVYIELPAVGKKVNAGEPFGVVESVKAASDLYAPLAGEVVQVNSELENNLQLLSDDPFGNGWMIKLKVTDPAAADRLLDHAAYQQHCASEEH